MSLFVRSHVVLLLLATLVAVLIPAAAAKDSDNKGKPAQRRKSSTKSTEKGELACVAQCDAEKTQMREAARQYSDENEKAVNQHNKLASDYNSLLKNHAELIKKYNKLISELEDPSLEVFLKAKAIQTYHHPGIEGAVNKTFIHILPIAQETLLQGQMRSVQWLNQTHSKVHNFLQSHAIGGEAVEEWLPAMSGFVVYGSVFIPVIIAFWCIVEFVCRLQQLILFGHVYLAVSGTSLAAFAWYTGADPLTTFAEQDHQLYQFAQCAFALMFILYGFIAVFALCCSHSDPLYRILHLLVTLCFGVVYYGLVWTPAMTDELPRIAEFVDSLTSPKGIATGQNIGGNKEHHFYCVPYVGFALIFALLSILEKAPTMLKVEDSADEHKAK